MYVLQECSICFEDYDADRQPHSIPCGHVFCQSCLESLVSTSPQCPNCRVSYASASIRKVICNLQDQDSTRESAAQESEAEVLMWQAIQSALESPQDLTQRKSIVQNNPDDALLATGMNKNVLTSLALMRFLVQVEEKNSSLKDKLNTSWAVEESLRDQISRLEAKLSLTGTNTCPSSEHFKLLLADVHKLQSAVDAINKNTSEVARHLTAKSEPPAPQVRPIEVPERRPPVPPPAPIPVSEPPIPPTVRKQPSRPGILRKSPPQDTNNSMANSPVESPIASRISLGVGNPPRQDPLGPTHHRYPSTPTPTGQLMSPPMTAEKDDDDDDEPLVPAEPKAKNPLEDSPKSAFNLEDWKRAYSNMDTRGAGGSLEWFYGKFDPEGFSIWRVDFKYNEELTQVFMSSNQIGGFFNRLEASKKYAFGSLGVLGEPNNSRISGVFVVRGQDYKPVLDVAPDWESYEYKKIDLSNPEDKAFFEAALAWDLEIDGKKWADGKNFK